MNIFFAMPNTLASNLPGRDQMPRQGHDFLALVLDHRRDIKSLPATVPAPHSWTHINLAASTSELVANGDNRMDIFLEKPTAEVMDDMRLNKLIAFPSQETSPEFFSLEKNGVLVNSSEQANLVLGCECAQAVGIFFNPVLNDSISSSIAVSFNNILGAQGSANMASTWVNIESHPQVDYATTHALVHNESYALHWYASGHLSYLHTNLSNSAWDSSTSSCYFSSISSTHTHTTQISRYEPKFMKAENSPSLLPAQSDRNLSGDIIESSEHWQKKLSQLIADGPLPWLRRRIAVQFGAEHIQIFIRDYNANESEHYQALTWLSDQISQFKPSNVRITINGTELSYHLPSFKVKTYAN